MCLMNLYGKENKNKTFGGINMKIGFVGNLFGTPKGHSYVVNNMVNAVMEAGHEAHMFRVLKNQITSEFAQPTTLKSNETFIIGEEDFEKWLDEVKPDWCVFMEYAQWWNEDHDKLDICRERGIKTLGWLVYEKLDWDKKDHYKKYTVISCPTQFQTKLLRKNGLYNSVYHPWGTDIKEIDKVTTVSTNPNRPIMFYHCAGSGGVGKRKNTEAVIKAYKQIRDAGTELKISHLNSKVFSRDEIIGFMKYADVLINASKWDTIGLNTMEANACGRPVIVANTSPMTELVQENVNGFLVDGTEKRVEEVTCPSYEVDIDELAKKMSICKNRIILETLQNNSRKYAEKNFDWNKNKEEFLKTFQ